MNNDEARKVEFFGLFIAYNVNKSTAEITATRDVYVKMTLDIPIEELRVVIAQCLIECKFLPTIAEIRERHRAISGGLGVQTAADAWESVVFAIRDCGYMRLPTFKNPTTARVVDGMGWLNLCMSENPSTDRAQFERMYNSMVGRQAEIERLLPQARAMLEEKVGTENVVSQLAERMRLPARPALPVWDVAEEEAPF